MDSRVGDFTGIKEIHLPVRIEAREGKYYGTRIVDLRGALVMTLWSDIDSPPSDREKKHFGSHWTEEAWADYCSDSHWEREADYKMGAFIVEALNLAARAT